MLARLLVAGAGTLGCEAGQLDTHLIKRAALAFAPGGVAVLALVLPKFEGCLLLAVLRHLIVGGERQHLLAGRGHSHGLLPFSTTTPFCRLPRTSARVCPNRFSLHTAH